MHELATPLLDNKRAFEALAVAEALQEWLAIQVDDPPSELITQLAKVWNSPSFGPTSATAALAQVVTGTYDPLVAVLCVAAQRVDKEIITSIPIMKVREEIIRLSVPFRFAPRYAREELHIGSHRILPGQRLVLGLATANMDSSVFGSPHLISAQNRPNHFSFGRGAHYCLGAPIARLTINATLSYFYERRKQFVVEYVEREPELSILRFRAMEGRITTID